MSPEGGTRAGGVAEVGTWSGQPGPRSPVRLRLGAAAELVPTELAELTPEEAAHIAGLGVRVLATHFSLAQMTDAQAEKARDLLDRAGLGIVQAAGFRTSLVEPDHDLRMTGIARLDEILGRARALGAEMFITGCGSLNPANFYAPAAENHDASTRARLVDSLRRAAEYAEKHRVVIALECHLLTTLDTPEHIREILDTVNSPWIKANFDPVNLLGDLTAVYQSGDAMRHMFDIIGSRYAKSAHVKDVIVGPDPVLHVSEAVPGEGVLDLAAFFDVCRAMGDDTAVVVEHLPRAQAMTAVQRIRESAGANGVTFV